MSSSRLWVRISNCSRDFLSTCGERFTVKREMWVGSGIGPTTRAPVRRAVSTISWVEVSRTRKSNALRRIRIFSLTIVVRLQRAASGDDVGDGAGADGTTTL